MKNKNIIFKKFLFNCLFIFTLPFIFTSLFLLVDGIKFSDFTFFLPAIMSGPFEFLALGNSGTEWTIAIVGLFFQFLILVLIAVPFKFRLSTTILFTTIVSFLFGVVGYVILGVAMSV